MIRGQRFEVDLGSNEEDSTVQSSTPLPGAFVGDVLERKTAAATAPSAPTLKSKTGFPEHQRRNKDSRFKQRDTSSKTQAALENQGSLQVRGKPQDGDSTSKASSGGKALWWEEEERQRIDLENRQKLAEMSPQEIEEERAELMNSLSPALLQRLLQRSSINSGSAEVDLSKPDREPFVNAKKPKGSSTKTVSFAEPKQKVSKASVPEDTSSGLEVDDQEAPLAEPLPHDSVHFPRPPQPPDLDPSSDTFLEDLHEKYFPSLPSDPEKLEWMQSSRSTKNSYNPSASTLSPKDIRFSFQGQLIPPKAASEIPVTAGLHHHGDAPDAAGYTIPELSHLGRSSFAAQRCIAFQTLGRILYRLGRGEFGDSGEPGADTVGAEDTFGELARGLWREMDKEKIVEMLVRESEGNGVDRGKHVSAKAYATEAVWLWRKGGGRTWKAA